jgi:hypothetical protein
MDLPTSGNVFVKVMGFGEASLKAKKADDAGYGYDVALNDWV